MLLLLLLLLELNVDELLDVAGRLLSLLLHLLRVLLLTWLVLGDWVLLLWQLLPGVHHLLWLLLWLIELLEHLLGVLGRLATGTQHLVSGVLQKASH